MPFLARVASRFRGSYNSKETQKPPTYIQNHDYIDSDTKYALRNDWSTRLESANSRCREDHDIEYISNGNNGYSFEGSDDQDSTYRRSKEHFSSWDIKEIGDVMQVRRPKSIKKNRDDNEANGLLDDRLGNGSAKSRNGVTNFGLSNRQAAESFDRENGKSGRHRRSGPWDREDDPPLRTRSEDRSRSDYAKTLKQTRENRNGDRHLLLREIDNLDSFERKDATDWRRWEKSNIEESKYKRNDYNDERSNRSRPKDADDNYQRKRNGNDDNCRLKRRSYAYEDTPEDFDGRGHKYERGRQDDPDVVKQSSPKDRNLGRKNVSKDDASRRAFTRDNNDDLGEKDSLKEQNFSIKRHGSLKGKEKSKHDRKSDRHSRPLTPPDHSRQNFYENFKDSPHKGSFSMKEWYEMNRQFATKYLKEHSKLRIEEHNGRSDVSAKDEFIFGSPKDVKGLNFIEDYERNQKNESYNRVPSKQIQNDSPSDSPLSGISTIDRNGATVIRIRTTSEDPVTIEKRRRRKSEKEIANACRRRYCRESDDEEDDADEDPERNRRRGGRNYVTPTRKIWNYRDGGVHITDIEEGQPCLQCGESCSGFFPHAWRKNCTSCKCPREAHDVCHDEWISVRARLGLKGDETKDPIGFEPREAGLAWAPPGLPLHKVEEYFSMLPEISVPRLGTAGERHRDRKLATQLPKQDLARAYCRHLDPQHSVSADDFMAARNEIALDIGSVQEVMERGIDCDVCSKPLKYGSLAVSASKLGLLYHPTCFRCWQCEELLVDLAYCVHNDNLYCERHYAEQLKPRCAACDELIFSGEYTKAMNKDWHSGHFCCWQCDESLTGQRYVLRDEHPYCIKCYESVFANGCEECSKIIGIDSKDLSYKDKHWHEACFLCNKCRVSLVDKQFGSKVDKIYCGNCYDSQFASRCDGCGEIFRAGTKKMEYKTRQWHEKCFCCCVCKNPIGTKSFIPREQEIYCAGCYEDKFATRCVKCNKIITSGGVTYKNEPWHRDCFTCSHCNNSLAGQRFTSRDDKPYCADCFGELFAKRCTACSKPITGIGGTRFISFEDRHWHNDCFICAGCNTSLVGRGFITDAEDIICPECAKQKLS